MTKKVFLIQSEGLGRGEEQLGSLLMANFLRLLGESQGETGNHYILEYRSTTGLRRFESTGTSKTA